MKKSLIIVILILFSSVSVWGLSDTKYDESKKQKNINFEEKQKKFIKNISSIAVDFIGMPYQLGGNPQISGTTDNSHLFFSIYSIAAQKAGLFYKKYLPMKYLLREIKEVNENDLKNGDLFVLNNGHAAMIYHVESSGKIHLIYSSERRQHVLSFNSTHLVFHAYWLENLKGFYRLPRTMLSSPN